MKKILETARLTLREFTPADAAAMYALNLDPEVLRYTGDMPFESEEEAASFLKNYREYEKNGFGRWAVLTKAEGVFIGWCGLKRNEEGMVDLGFRFFRAHWNKGYATEAARACLKFGFEKCGLEKIVGRAARANAASVRVLEKIGMTFWKNAPCRGLEDSVYYLITNPEYKKHVIG